MKMIGFRISKTQFLFYIFFFTYFLTYIGEMTIFKYLCTVIFQIFLLIHYRKFEIRRLDKGIMCLLVCIFLCLIISLFSNFNYGGAIKTLSLIDLFILSYFFLARGLTNFKISHYKLFDIITSMLFFALVIAFVFHFNDTVIAVGRSTGPVARHRFGTGAESIVGFLCFIEFTLAFYMFYIKRKLKKSVLFPLIQCCLAVYMSYLASIRTAIVSMVFFVIMFFYNKLPRNKTTLLFKYLVFMFSVVAIVVLSGSVSMDINTLNYVFSSRFVYYERAINDILSNNAILFGLGSFRNSAVDELSRVQVDNSYIDIFYQYGFLCLTPLCLLLLTIARRLNKISSYIGKHANLYDYNNFINAYFITILVYSMGEKNLFSLSSALSLVSFIVLFNYLECYKKILFDD